MFTEPPSPNSALGAYCLICAASMTSAISLFRSATHSALFQTLASYVLATAFVFVAVYFMAKAVAAATVMTHARTHRKHHEPKL